MTIIEQLKKNKKPFGLMLIEQLKNNEKPFGLMSEDMQEKAKEINEGFDVWSNNRWVKCGTARDFSTMYTYRLRPGYEEEPKIIECEFATKDISGDFYEEGYMFEGKFRTMDLIPQGYTRVGFKFEDKEAAYPYPRMYKDKSGFWISVWKEGFRVLTPTHVCFRSKP